MFYHVAGGRPCRTTLRKNVRYGSATLVVIVIVTVAVIAAVTAAATVTVILIVILRVP